MKLSPYIIAPSIIIVATVSVTRTSRGRLIMNLNIAIDTLRVTFVL